MSDNRPAPSAADTEVEIGGATYTLRYSILAMSALQKHLRLASISEVVARLGDVAVLGVDDVVAFFWAGLRTHHRDIDFDGAMAILDAGGIEALGAVLGQAFAGSLPPPKPADDEDGEGEGEGGGRDPTKSRSPSTGS